MCIVAGLLTFAHGHHHAAKAAVPICVQGEKHATRTIDGKTVTICVAQ
jgi:hypothetical protein